jgi:hypothetical protein
MLLGCMIVSSTLFKTILWHSMNQKKVRSVSIRFTRHHQDLERREFLKKRFVESLPIIRIGDAFGLYLKSSG